MFTSAILTLEKGPKNSDIEHTLLRSIIYWRFSPEAAQNWQFYVIPDRNPKLSLKSIGLWPPVSELLDPAIQGMEAPKWIILT